MTFIQILFTILLLIASLMLIVSVLLQKGDADGISALAGGSGGNNIMTVSVEAALGGSIL